MIVTFPKKRGTFTFDKLVAGIGVLLGKDHKMTTPFCAYFPMSPPTDLTSRIDQHFTHASGLDAGQGNMPPYDVMIVDHSYWTVVQWDESLHPMLKEVIGSWLNEE